MSCIGNRPKQDADAALFEGLQALSDSAFPKTCSYCGRHFTTAEDFVRQTQGVPSGSGLKSTRDDASEPILELYRNCVCGSTLMDFFSDRRQPGERGRQRRARFAKLLDMLVARNMPRDQARQELLALMRSGYSEALAAMGFTLSPRKTPQPMEARSPRTEKC